MHYENPKEVRKNIVMFKMQCNCITYLQYHCIFLRPWLLHNTDQKVDALWLFTIVLHGTVTIALDFWNAMTFHLSPMVVCAKRSGTTIVCSSCNRIVIFIRVRLQNQYCQVNNAMQLSYLFAISLDIFTFIILAFLPKS